MIVRQYAPCNLGRNTICLGKQGEINALRVEFDVSAWMAMYPDATVKLMHFAPDRTQDNPVIPTLGVEGTTRVWIVGEDDTANAGNGVIELLLIDERTGSTIKSATGYTTVLHSPSAGIEAQEAEAGYVRYDIDQSALLTDEQKAVARKNIGAGTGDGTGGGTGGITVEKDPTVPAWAKQPRKPTYTASEVGARPDTWMPSASDVGADAAGTASAQVGAHNVSGEAHADLRALIEGLTSRLNALADSDDDTLDQLSEIVAYIKSNKAMIDAVTTGKVSTSDIVDNLTTNASGKVLSAAQGVALKAMIDGIVIPTALPNPQPITINGQRYDGSAKVEVTVTGEGGGANINDTTPSSTTTYSSQKIESELNALNEAIDAKGDPTDEQVSTAVNAYLTENPVSAGLTKRQVNALHGLFKIALYQEDASGAYAEFMDAFGGKETYTVTHNLSDVLIDNDLTTVEEESSYTATLTPAGELVIDTVEISMGGVDITSTAYADGVISITSVTGDIVITASAVAQEGSDLMYRLASPVTFDGTQTELIDTGLALMSESDMDWSIYYNAVWSTNPERYSAAFSISCLTMNPAVSALYDSARSKYNFDFYDYRTDMPIGPILITHTKSQQYCMAYAASNTSGIKCTGNKTYVRNDETLKLGGRVTSTGIDRLFNGTLNELEVYNRVLTIDEIKARLGVE